jgi:N-acetylmuramic acid 6-phosphate etherase
LDLSHLLTEQHRPELADLDLRTTVELVELMTADQMAAMEAVAGAAPAITAAIDAVVGQLEKGGRLIYVGAGTAGRLGLLDAAECPPTFTTDKVVAVMAGGPDAFLVSREAVEDVASVGGGDMDAIGVTDTDAVVGLAASGRTPYTVGAVIRAAELGAVTIGVSCNPDAELSRHVDHPIEVVVGPEIIAGSTRLKGGTAQKTVLNMISTVSMVRTGKTFGNLMVDLRATNQKLRDRARRIVVQATGAGLDRADRALGEAEGDVKVAILMLLNGTAAGPARERLAAHRGRVRDALEGRT